MTIKTAYSDLSSIDDAVNSLKEQLYNLNPKTVLFFASSIYEPVELAKKMQNAFENSLTFGCTTAGEIISGKMLKNSIVAMAFSANAISDMKIAVMENISYSNSVDEAFQVFENYFQTPMLEMDFSKFVGIILIDGMSGAEEKIMDRIGDLTNVLFVGGSAGDDLKFKKTYVFAEGKAYTNAAVLALMKPALKFDIIKTQSFNDTGKKLVASKVEESDRRVIEFNNKPASNAYAEALGVSVDQASDYFMHNPLGLMSEGEPFVRSPQQFIGSDMKFYCNIKKGMELNILESTNIIRDTKMAIQEKFTKLGGITGLINFHCILRTLELEKKNQTEDYGKIFADFPTIGFSTYGEEFIGHVNQTSTMLVFK